MKWFTRLLLATGLLIGSAFAQGGGYSGTVQYPSGQSVPTANVRVCNVPASGFPCSNLATLFTDSTLSVGISNPIVLTPQSFGQYSFGAASGNYQIQITGTGLNNQTALASFSALTYPIVVSSTGVFTNTIMNEYVKSTVGTCNTATEAQRFNAGANMTDAITACLGAPVGASVGAAAAISGFATNSAADSGLGYAVGVLGQGTCLASDSKCVGGIFIAGDANGIGATGDVEPFGAIFELFQNNPASSYQLMEGVGITGVFGFAPPSFAQALNITAVNFPFPTGIILTDGAATVGLNVGAACFSGSCASQSINLHGMTAGVADTITSLIYTGKGAPAGGTCVSGASGKAGLYIREDGAANTTLYVCDNTSGTWTAVNVP